MRFERVPVLLAGAVPFTEAEAEAEQLGDDIREAARRLTDP